MKEYKVFGIIVRFEDHDESTLEEAVEYYQHMMKRFVAKGGGSRSVKKMIVRRDGEWADIEYVLDTPPFERIRRITGYLVGTTDRWNNAKNAELKDRVTHEAD